MQIMTKIIARTCAATVTISTLPPAMMVLITLKNIGNLQNFCYFPAAVPMDYNLFSGKRQFLSKKTCIFPGFLL